MLPLSSMPLTMPTTVDRITITEITMPIMEQIRPGVFDCFVNAPLFNHLWIVELFLTFSLLFGSFLIIKALRRNNFASGGFFLCLVCLFPVGLEATYWIAAATRVVYSLLFIGCATLSLDYCYKSDKVKFLVMFAVFGIWKDTERILAEHAFVYDHKFPSLQAIVDYRKSLSQQMETLAAQRAEIVKQMRRKDAPPELADQRMALTCEIAKLRKEDKIAEGAIKRIQRTRESNRIDRENQEHHTNHNRRRNRSRQR